MNSCDVYFKGFYVARGWLHVASHVLEPSAPAKATSHP